MKQFDYHLYTDAYFLRSLEILKGENLNPYVRYQIFFRGEDGLVSGVSEVMHFLAQSTDLFKHGGGVFALSDGEIYSPEETVMVLEGYAQDLITTETVLLGMLSHATTKKNGGRSPDPQEVTGRIGEIVALVQGRSVVYFGARHFHFRDDEVIARAAFTGGVSDCSTDSGAKAFGKKGVGTIPHALECIYAWKYGGENAVLESTKAFDRVIAPEIPRIALIDFANRERDDAVRVAESLGSKLFGIRVDTAGENMMQGQEKLLGHENDPFWYGKGVTVGGVYALKKALLAGGFDDVKIVLSSGFGNPEKVKAFISAEKELGLRLFDMLGVGEVAPGRFATMDIVGVGEEKNSLRPIAKAGREYKPNPRLKSIL